MSGGVESAFDTANRKARAAMIHDAMQRTNGHRPSAAKLLGISPLRLKEYLRSNKTLRECWYAGRAIVPTELDTIHRTAPLELAKAAEKIEQELSVQDVRVGQNLAKEDTEILRHGLAGLNLTEREMDLGLSLQRFYGRNFRSSIEIIGGGVTRTALKLMSEMDSIADRLTVVRTNLRNAQSDEAKASLVDEEKNLMTCMIQVADVLRRINQMANDGAATMAKIRLLIDAKTKQAKPGFRPAPPATATPL